MRESKLYSHPCPLCAARVFIGHAATKKCEIEWDATSSTFLINVHLKLCNFCDRRTGNKSLRETVQKIPVLIAEKSICACGATMILDWHKIECVADDFVFSANYVCASCGKNESTLLKKITKGIKRFWADTRKVEIGASGISYEKYGSEK